MEKKLTKKEKPLSLHKETLRVLLDPELRQAIGGLPTYNTCSWGLCCPEN